MKFYVVYDSINVGELGDCSDFNEACEKADNNPRFNVGPSWVLDIGSLRLLQGNIEDVLKKNKYA